MKSLIIIGGSNIDYYAQASTPIKPHDSNEGTLNVGFGGVGRNIAENLGRLGLNPMFITALSMNDEGHNIYQHLRQCGVETTVIPSNKTSSYVAVLDETSDLYVGINDMSISEKSLSISALKPYEKTLYDAKYVVVDTNLPNDSLDYLFTLPSIDYIVDGISETKVLKLKDHLPMIHTLKVNMQELEALLDCKLTNKEERITACKKILNAGVEHVFLTMGEMGVYHCQKNHLNHKAVHINTIKNTTGAGDAFLAGAIYGMIHFCDPLSYGMASSYINLNSEKSVSEKLSESLLKDTQRSLKYE